MPTFPPEGFLPPLLPQEPGLMTLVARVKTPMACYKRPMRLHDYAPQPAHIKWLLASDPAIRWQVMRDLAGESAKAVAAERSRVATEGWGAQLLARQSP